jgi:hypothetical protein
MVLLFDHAYNTTVMSYRMLGILPLLIGLATACRTPQLGCTPPPDYVALQERWREARFDELLTPRGWVALAGLYWLSPGDNTFGSDPANAVVFPEGAPAALGVIRLGADGALEVRFAPQADVYVDGVPADAYGWRAGQPAPLMEKDDWTWTFIERGGRYGLRLWDTARPTRIRMRPIPHYPDDAAWLVSARWEAAARPETLLVRNVLGMDVPTPVAGRLSFQVGGKDCRLTALAEGPDKLFLIFSDETTGEQTYPAGRYLYCSRPADGERVCIDFNQAINPPCAFTEYATCLLPPAENHLPVAILAGEQALDH